MDIYQQFDLPPAPPPTFFSHHSDATGARLPNFTTVQEAADYVDSLVYWHHPPLAARFFLLTSIALLLLVCLCGSLFLSRIARGSWWLLRLVDHSDGRRYLVPAACNSFHVSMAAFGILLACWLSLIYASQRGAGAGAGGVGKPVHHVGAWLTLTWSPIALGAWYQTWALIASRRESRRLVPAVFAVRALPAWVGNAVHLVVPLVPILLAVWPGVLADRHSERARVGWVAWRRAYGGAGELGREMLVDAQQIHVDVLRFAYHTSIALCIWISTCIVFGGAYYYAVITVVLELRQHISIHRTAIAFQRSLVELKGRSNEAQTQQTQQTQQAQELEWALKEPWPSTPTVVPSDWETAWVLRTEGATQPARHEKKSNTRHNDDLSSLTHNLGLGLGPTYERKPTLRTVIDDKMYSYLFSPREQAEDRLCTRYVPPVRPSKNVTKLEVAQAEAVLVYFMVYSASIMLGCLGFIGVISYCLRTWYPSTESATFAPHLTTSAVVMSAVCLFFGTTCSGSILQSSWEASFAALLHCKRGREEGEGV